MLWKRVYIAIEAVILSFFSLLIFSCQLFENDVSNFMELYTETAAIDNNEITV